MTPLGSKNTQLPARRRADLVDFIRSNGQATVIELAETFGVSSDTVRRDLDHLAEQGVLTRTHGGAVPADDLATADNPLLTRMGAQSAAKARIAEAAAALVGDGQTVIVNGGTTTLALAGHLAERRDLTIVTNNLLLPPALPQGIARDVYVIGGVCRMRALVTIGRLRFPDAEGVTSHAISADLAIIGVGSVSPDGTLSTSDLREAQMMREMIRAAKRVAVLADSSKFERSAFAHICGPDEFDVLVTDAEVPPVAAAAFDDAGVEVIVAG
jgi:DeoR/GlpR family transcriptional regulator of sugar metabolism